MKKQTRANPPQINTTRGFIDLAPEGKILEFEGEEGVIDGGLVFLDFHQPKSGEHPPQRWLLECPQDPAVPLRRRTSSDFSSRHLSDDLSLLPRAKCPRTDERKRTLCSGMRRGFCRGGNRPIHQGLFGEPCDEDGIELLGINWRQCPPGRRFARNPEGSPPLATSPTEPVGRAVNPDSSQ